jgi:hypothetical protein
MKVIGICCAWVLGAVMCAAVVIGVLTAVPLIEQGVPTGQLPGRVLFALSDGMSILLYAAIGGVLIGLLILIPATVRANTEKLVSWTIFGAISGAVSVACGVFLYKAYALSQAGMNADALPLNELLTNEMQLQNYIPYGAIAGAALAIVLVVIAVLREGQARNAAAALANTHTNDPDTIIRAQRAQRAQQYLAERSQRDAGMSKRS